MSELPEVRDTLLLRHLGAGKVLRRAIAELEALGPEAVERMLAKLLLLKFKLEVPVDPAQRTQDDEEFLMDTPGVVERWENETLQKGGVEGLIAGLIDVYEARFGAMPRELGAALGGGHPEPTLHRRLTLAATRSAEEIAAALRAPQAS